MSYFLANGKLMHNESLVETDPNDGRKFLNLNKTQVPDRDQWFPNRQSARAKCLIFVTIDPLGQCDTDTNKANNIVTFPTSLYARGRYVSILF